MTGFVWAVSLICRMHDLLVCLDPIEACLALPRDLLTVLLEPQLVSSLVGIVTSLLSDGLLEVTTAATTLNRNKDDVINLYLKV